MIPKTGNNFQVNGFIEIDWQRLKQLLAGTNPIWACLKAAKEPAATPTHVNPNKKRMIRKHGIIAKPIKAPLPPLFSTSKVDANHA